MADLRIYMHPSGDGVLYQSGLSWIAAFAFPLWALTRRLYKTAVVSCVAILALTQLIPLVFNQIHNDKLRGIMAFGYTLAYWFAAGSLAHRWHRYVLERRGYFICAARQSAATGLKK